MMEDVEVGLNISATLTLKFTKKVFMMMEEVDIGLRPAPFPPIIKVILLDFWVFLFMVMREVDICLRPAN